MARRKPRVQTGVVSPRAAARPLRFLVLPASVFALAVAVYAPTLSADWTSTDDTELVLDDAAFLSSDGALRAAFGRPFFPLGPRRAYYRPLVTVSFVLDTPRGERPTPEPYHRTNVLLHAASSAAVFFFVNALGVAPVASALAAALFAIHPVTAQTVAWIPGRCDGLMALFALGALIAWIAFDRTSSRRAILAHHALFAAALFSKEAAIALPLAAVAHSLVVTKRSAFRAPIACVGWAFVGAVWFVLRRSAVGAIDSSATLGTALHNSSALIIGMGKLLVPVELDVLATLRDSSLLPGAFAVGLLAAASLTIRTARRCFLWAAVALPLLFLLPALAVSDFLILDNRLYLPLAGIAAGAALCAEAWGSRLPKQVLGGAWAVAAIVLAVSTRRHADSFSSPRAFSEAAVSGSPHLGLAHLNLGAVEYRDGRLDDAKKEFERALAENPTEPVAHNDLGLVYLNSGDLERAESEFTNELRANPNYSKAHFNLGLVLERTGRLDLAREHFEKTVTLVPGDTEAWGELLKYWAPRDAARAETIEQRMESLGVHFFSP